MHCMSLWPFFLQLNPVKELFVKEEVSVAILWLPDQDTLMQQSLILIITMVISFRPAPGL